jgi:hypothetical protein
MTDYAKKWKIEAEKEDHQKIRGHKIEYSFLNSGNYQAQSVYATGYGKTKVEATENLIRELDVLIYRNIH